MFPELLGALWGLLIAERLVQVILVLRESRTPRPTVPRVIREAEEIAAEVWR